MPIFLLIAVGVWFWLGDPLRSAAGWFWPQAAAPWEQVDAFYYPDATDLTVHQEWRNAGSVEACRDFVKRAAYVFGDASLSRGDYECGVGPKVQSDFGGITVYRITVQ